MRENWLLLVVLCSFCGSVAANEIRLGVSNATAGPASRLGLDLNTGAELYFNSQYFKQLLPQHSVTLVKYDDGYEPDNTLYNTKRLLGQDVLALFNYVGTPTSKSVMATVKLHAIPFITPFTGADFLRRPDATNIYNLRASYEQEAKAQMAYLIERLKFKRIAILIQADEFGLALEKYHLEAFNQYGLNPVAQTRYKRNTLDVVRVSKRLLKAKPEAVLFVGTYRPLNELIRLMAIKNQQPVFASVSFISSQVLFELVPDDTKLVITEVVPDPTSCNWAVCQQFMQEAKANQMAQVNRVQFEGYLNALYLSKAASLCQNTLNKACLASALEQTQVELGEQSLSFSKQFRQMNHNIYLNLMNLP